MDFHRSHKKTATITTVNLGQSKGVLNIDDNNSVLSFREKDDNDGALINGGFMVLNPEVFDRKRMILQFLREPMERLAAEGQMKSTTTMVSGSAWTQQEMKKLEELWQSKNAPWKIWKD